MSEEPIIETVVKTEYQTLAKALWVVAAGLVSVAVAIFGAGVYWATVYSEIDIYKKKIDDNVSSIQALQAQNTKLKADLNTQFSRLLDIPNAEQFKNEATSTSGAYSPDRPPGRCAPGEVIVGLQPMQAGWAINFQYGKLPQLKLD